MFNQKCNPVESDSPEDDQQLQQESQEEKAQINSEGYMEVSVEEDFDDVREFLECLYSYKEVTGLQFCIFGAC